MVIKNKKINLRVLLRLLLIISGISYITFIFYIGFKNPDMTGTRLLITYWKGYSLGIGTIIIIGACRIVEEVKNG